MRVAEAAASAPRDHRLLADLRRGRRASSPVASSKTAVPGGTARHEVVAGLAVAPRPLAAAAGRGLEVVAVAEVAEGRLAGIDPQVDGAAAAAVAAVGAAAGNVGLAAERRRAVAAVTGANPDLDPVEEHRADCPMGARDVPPGRRRAPRGTGAG